MAVHQYFRSNATLWEMGVKESCTLQQKTKTNFTGENAAFKVYHYNPCLRLNNHAEHMFLWMVSLQSRCNFGELMLNIFLPKKNGCHLLFNGSGGRLKKNPNWCNNLIDMSLLISSIIMRNLKSFKVREAV